MKRFVNYGGNSFGYGPELQERDTVFPLAARRRAANERLCRVRSPERRNAHRNRQPSRQPMDEVTRGTGNAGLQAGARRKRAKDTAIRALKAASGALAAALSMRNAG